MEPGITVTGKHFLADTRICSTRNVIWIENLGFFSDVGQSPYMVFEYMEYGDLAELLRKNDPILRKTDDCVVLQKVWLQLTLYNENTITKHLKLNLYN